MGANRSRIWGLASGLALTLTLAAPSLAQDMAIEGGHPSQLTLSLTVRSRVQNHCGFTPGQAPDGERQLGNLMEPFGTELAFALRCNTPSRVAVMSANGGLKAADLTVIPPGTTALAPYEVEMRLVGDEGVSAASGTCTAETLVAGGSCPFRGPATAGRGLLLNGMSTDVPGSSLRITGGEASPELAASSAYSDLLTVTISPVT